jgi:hypothetical protein
MSITSPISDEQNPQRLRINSFCSRHFLIAITLLLGVSVFAQGDRTLRGVVTNEAGELLAGVVVIGAPQGPVVTDEKGRFGLTNPDVTLHFSKEKFQVLTLSVSLHTSDLHIVLTPPVNDMRLPYCSRPAANTKRLGYNGLYFDIPTREATIETGLGGDYVLYAIKPKSGKGSLGFQFGALMGFSAPPADEFVTNSAKFQQRNVVDADGKELGLDSRGTRASGQSWRRMGLFSQGGEYESTRENVALFDRILNSACLDPEIYNKYPALSLCGPA